MQKCGIYLQPTKFEGFGLAILEAMSCGAPIITSPVGAVPEVVGQSAVFCDGKDPRSIADAILFVQKHPCRAEQLGTEASIRAGTFFPMKRRIHSLRQIIDAVVTSC